jgi:hypothetical protein
MWGRFPALRRALEEKTIPARLFGATTASDNMFDQINRLLRIAVLVCEFEDCVKETARSANHSQTCEDLMVLENDLDTAASFLSQSIERVRELGDSIRSTAT